MLQRDGKQYARVTEVLTHLQDFSNICQDVLERKKNIGTSVHKAIKDDIDGEIPFIDEGTASYYKSYCEWKEIMTPKIVQSEERYFCDIKKITGQIDALITFKHGSEVPILIDFKTSAQQNAKIWPLQAHLYRYLLTQNGIETQDRFLFIKLDKTGKMPTTFEYLFSEKTLSYCLNLIDLFWTNKLKDNQLT